MLWLCLHLPQLSLEVWTRGVAGDFPQVVSEGRGNQVAILSANHEAQHRGIYPGLSLQAAHALATDLVVYTRDPSAEQQALKIIAAWLGRFSSQVSLVPSRSLVLEIEGSLTLFKGLPNLWREISKGMMDMEYEVGMAFAPTPLAATWLAQSGQTITCKRYDAFVREPVTCERIKSILRLLPVSVLDLENRGLASLRRMGLRTLGDCWRLPRDGLARRLGAGLLQQLDQALGLIPDPRKAYVAPPRFEQKLSLPAETRSAEALLFALQRLLGDLQTVLQARQAGVRSLTLRLRHYRDSPTTIVLKLSSPVSDATYWLRLFRERFSVLQLKAPVTELCLAARSFLSLDFVTGDFFRRNRTEEGHHIFLERLRARLGDQAVQGLETVEEHRPEMAWRYCAPGKANTKAEFPLRPLWLLPEPLALKTDNGRPQFNGPLTFRPNRERLESGWWDGKDMRRDYFLVRSRAGAWFWVYRETESLRWFLHGIFD